MAFVTFLPLSNRSVRLRATSSRVSASSTVRASASTPGRSTVFQSFLDSSKTKQWVAYQEPAPEVQEQSEVTPVKTVDYYNPSPPSGQSRAFSSFLKTQRSKQLRTYDEPATPPKPSTVAPGTRPDATKALNVASSPFFLEYVRQQGSGYVDRDARKALLRNKTAVDDYVAACARRQYIQAQNSSGVFGPSCTEGTVRGAADEARVAALAAEFRRHQVSGVASFADLFETRRLAFAVAQGCNYEESLVARFPDAARATVIGTMEKVRACSRYADPVSTAEEYMADCVERAASSRAAPSGIYGGMCCDGTTKGAAESKRVAALATKYCNGTFSSLTKLQMYFDQAKFARTYFSNGCNYEDELFTEFPATAACAVRPAFARY